MLEEQQTERLLLRRPRQLDIDDIHAINSDPRVWEHYPSLRHTTRAMTERLLQKWTSQWEEHGIGSWTVRLRTTGEVIGNGGCSLRGADDEARIWNLGYRISADHHGHGYATELSRHAVAVARELRPDVPVIAYLVEHNRASAAVAQKVGLTLVHRGPDAGNPDASVMRLIYADRTLTPAQLQGLVS